MEQSFQTIEYAFDEGVSRITLNRPDRMNSLNYLMIQELVAAFGLAAQDDRTRAVLLSAAGDRAFCGGYDLKGMGQPFDPPSANKAVNFEQRVERVENAIMSCPKPVVVAVRGHAIGSGLDVVLSCDYLIAAESARFSESRVHRANMTTVHWLPLFVGWAMAREMILRGTVVEGRQAKDIGLVNQVVPDQELDRTAAEVVAEFATGPTLALSLYKRALNTQIASTVQTGQEARHSYGLLLQGSADLDEARAAFREKRPPAFVGR